MGFMEYAWFFWIQQIYHGKCKDIFVEQWGARTILKNNTKIRQKGAK
jgi:hypothetical protein